MEIILPLVVVLGIFHTFRIYLAGRAARKAYESVEYLTSSTENTDLWRWRQPVDGIDFALVDEAETSRIEFAPAFNSMDWFLTVAGGLAYLTSVVCLVTGLGFHFWADGSQAFRGTAAFLLSGFGLFFGVAAFAVRQRLTALTRTPTHLIVEYAYGTMLRRRLCYPRDATVAVKVKTQSITDYDVEQEAPFYIMTLKRIHFLRLFGTQLYVAATPTQMSWIQGGLNDWFSPEKPGA